MTIEEKAKAYDEALAKAVKIHRKYKGRVRAVDVVIEEVFPELQENEDERIRKDILVFIKHEGQYIDKLEWHKWIAWLEKQGEKSDKNVKPKFKVGDWVIDSQGIVHQIGNVIENVTNHTYGYDIVGGGYFNDNVEGVRLWTIQDAKAGDVLVDEDNNIGIYKEIEGICWHSYIYLGCDNRLYGFGIGGSHIQNNTKPATKEQRDLLFQRIHEAGYMWDSESKQLLSLKAEPIDEQKSVWSEEDDKILKSIIINIENLQFSEDMREKYHHIPNANKSYYQIKIDWLKSIKERVVPQQKQEWSEEDKEVINLLLELIYEQDKISPRIPSHEKRKMMLSWLKSLRPQNTWKPSDEQMDVLLSEVTAWTKGCPKQIVLESLYNDLKKLKG